MSNKNWFGPRDSVVSLTPPEGFEAVHQEGMTWYKDGINEFETTKKFAYEFNSEIAQLRGLLTVSGIDLSDLPENSPFLLREVILRAIMRILSMQEIDGYGLLDKATYDPQGKETDPFARANHTGTQPISTVLNLQANLDSKVGLAGTQEIVGHKRFRSSGAVATPSGAASMLEVFANPAAGNAAFMAFHRSGAHAAYFGIDTDNKLKIGGWSLGANAHEIWHAGNFTPGNYLPTAGGVMQSGAIIQYAADVGEKIRLYGGSYGIGIQSSELTLWGSASAALRFRQGGLAGAVLGELTSAGFKLPTATPTDNLHAASKQYVDSKVSTVGLYTGSNVDETAFPVGHIVCAVAGADPDRNAAGDVRIATGTLDYTIGGGGAQLAGTWRARGRTSTGNKLMQRVA